MNGRFLARKLGQNFLMNRDIAAREAEHAYGKTVLEIGPGRGILTEELCARAKKVIAVEKDGLLYSELKRNLNADNLELIKADFLKLGAERLDPGSVDMVIANIPYGISSEVMGWLSRNGKEALLCLQKEFVQRMLAKEGTREYSKLSVVCSLGFRITEIMDVPAGNFNPKPSVDSEIIFIKPLKSRMTPAQEAVISALMQHKKKTIRSALIDSRSHFGATKAEMSAIASALGGSDRRVFMLSPEELLSVADSVSSLQKTKGS